MITDTAGQAQYLLLSDALKRLPGRAFEGHAHPAVVLDRATGASTQVWGWWTDASPTLPCLLWRTDRGWSATLVEPDTLDTAGYEREFWSHRIKLLDLALANALGPYPTLEDLEIHVAAAASFGLGTHDKVAKRAMCWGILQLRAARAQANTHSYHNLDNPRMRPVAGGLIDTELVRHALIPSLAKTRPGRLGRRRDRDVPAVIRPFSRVRPQATMPPSSHDPAQP